MKVCAINVHFNCFMCSFVLLELNYILDECDTSDISTLDNEETLQKVEGNTGPSTWCNNDLVYTCIVGNNQSCNGLKCKRTRGKEEEDHELSSLSTYYLCGMYIYIYDYIDAKQQCKDMRTRQPLSENNIGIYIYFSYVLHIHIQ